MRPTAGRIIQWLESERLWRRTRPLVAELRQQTLDSCRPADLQEIRPRRPERLVLAVVGGYPFLGYVRLGYDWVGPYYNPQLLFDEVHYFQTATTRNLVLDVGYPLFIHSFSTAADVVRICRQNRVDVLRAYDPDSGAIAVKAAKELNVPVLVSVH